MTPANDTLARAMSEEALLTAVTEALDTFRWRWCHFRPARTEKGWRTLLQGHRGLPDIIAVRDSRLLFCELKAERGQLSPAQWDWVMDLGRLKGPGETVEVYIWRPSNWFNGTIMEVLR